MTSGTYVIERLVNRAISPHHKSGPDNTLHYFTVILFLPKCAIRPHHQLIDVGKQRER